MKVDLMKHFTLFAIFLTLTGIISAQSILPNYMTAEEHKLYKTYRPPVYSPKFTTPPDFSVRAMAEWEELQGIMITWTSFPVILRQIVDYAQEECMVYIVCSDSNSVKTTLTGYGIPLYNIKYLIYPYNSIWIRDYGPWSAYMNSADSLNIMDWIYNRPRANDDLVPGLFAGSMNLPFYEATAPPNDLVHTGGNFMVDGHGTGFASKLILQENTDKSTLEIDSILFRYLGIDRFIKMETLPYDGIHHIDMHMKLLNEETLLVGEYPTGISDGPQIEANLQYVLNNFQTCFGRDYKVVRIPMPPDQYGRYPNQNGYYRTYTNSMIINKTVLVPIYNCPEDSLALEIYRQAMPGYNIAGINCNSIIPLSGALHCIIKEVGVADPLFISHAPVRNNSEQSGTQQIEAAIEHVSGIEKAQVFWTTDTSAGFDSLQMSAAISGYIAEIPAQPAGSMIYYYIKAVANNGKSAVKPSTAPTGYFAFESSGITAIASKGYFSAADFNLLPNFPNPFNPATTIRFNLSKPADLKFSIFNSIGQQINKFEFQNLQPGQHSFKWNGLSEDGQPIPSGVYFLRMQADAFFKTSKMLLVK